MSERLLEALERKARKRHPKIAIGAGSQRDGYTEKVIQAAGAVDFADVIVVGDGVLGGEDLEVVESKDPEFDLVRLLKTDRVDAAIRGSCGASKTLSTIKSQFKPGQIGRIAFLQTSSGREFLFAPVGIDEGNSVEEKMFLAMEGIQLADRIGIEPRVGVLSGGRKGDVGRHKKVDKSIADAEKLVGLIKDKGFLNTKNYDILVEDAISDNANFIIAPDGISGNLMFRTLAFLGGGKGFGAPIVGIEKVFVDTSRAGNPADYISAMKLAAGLAA